MNIVRGCTCVCKYFDGCKEKVEGLAHAVPGGAASAGPQWSDPEHVLHSIQFLFSKLNRC